MTTVWLLLLVVVIASSQKTIDNDACVTDNYCKEHVKDMQTMLEYQQQLLQTITSRFGKSEQN